MQRNTAIEALLFTRKRKMPRELSDDAVPRPPRKMGRKDFSHEDTMDKQMMEVCF
jgi:hypothetical protein